MRIYPVFYISLLELALPDVALEIGIEIEGDEYEVEEILDSRKG
jgi:hypothetical protein